MMAHKTEHVAADGFDDGFDRIGGTWGFESNVDDTEVYATVPSNAIETAFWLFSDQMGFLKPAIDAPAIAWALQVFGNDRAKKVANAPMGLADELIPSELYPAGHPYRHVPRAGDAAALASLTPADVTAFVDKYFVPSNAVLVVVGDAKLNQVMALATKWFGSIPGGAPPAYASIPVPSPQNEIHLDIAARVERPVVRMTWVTPSQYAPGDAELDVVADILHGNRIARLSWELITKLRLVGEIHTHEFGAPRGSTFTITLMATPGHTAQEVQKAADDILGKLETTEPPDADDMQGALVHAHGPDARDGRLRVPCPAARDVDDARWDGRLLADGHAPLRDGPDAGSSRGAAVLAAPQARRRVHRPSATAPVSGKLLARKVQ